MSDFFLRTKLIELCKSNSTLLWLEGSRYECVKSVKLSGERLVLALADNTSRVVCFERYAVTNVGLQFWSNGRPGVLYRWDRVPVHTAQVEDLQNGAQDEPPTPPDMAA